MNRKLILQYYESGLSSIKISKIMHTSKRTILNYLHNSNIIMRSIKINKLIERIIIDDYQNNYSPNDIAYKNKINRSTVVRILNRYKVYRRNFHESINYKIVNIPKPDSDLFYYFIGLILTDGWVYKNKLGYKYVGFGCTDKETVIYLRNKISPGRKIQIIYPENSHISKYTKCKATKTLYRLVMPIDNSTECLLREWGCIYRKSNILKPTKNLLNINEKQFMQLFVGLIEGDGTICWIKHKKYKYLRMYYYGTKEMCKYVLNRIGYGTIVKNRNIYRITWTHRQSINLILKIKKHTTIRTMLRKWNKVLDI